ncbi:mCG147059 [Mus musculus]|nr:mCG147059 [Mus musculus]
MIFYSLDVIVISGSLPLSANLGEVLEASSLHTILSRPRMFSSFETYC